MKISYPVMADRRFESQVYGYFESARGFLPAHTCGGLGYRHGYSH